MSNEIQRVHKPWGYELIWARSSSYAGKILVIHAGGMLSRQYHERKEETIYVLQGTLRLELGKNGEDVRHLAMGEAFHIAPGTVHRFCAEETEVRLAEVSSPELDDVVRLHDDYGRAPSPEGGPL